MNYPILLFLALACSSLIAPAVCAQAQNEPDPVVATINGKRQIRLRELDQSTRGEVRKYEQQIDRIRRQALDLLIDRLLIEAEAEARGIDAEALIRELVPKDVSIAPERLEKSYAEYLPSLRHLGEVEARLRVRLDLESSERMASFKAALAEMRRRAKIEIRLPAPDADLAPATVTAPALGGAGARVELIVYSDYQCPSCREVAPWLQRLARQFPNDLRIIHKNFPLPIHPQAFMAARAAYCANEQGRFWSYHERLFAERDLSEQMLVKYAAETELDEIEFERCLESDASRDAVLEELHEARALNLQGTPTFIINGRIQLGVRSFEELASMIEKELRESGTER